MGSVYANMTDPFASSLGFLLPSQYGSGAIESEPSSEYNVTSALDFRPAPDMLRLRNGPKLHSADANVSANVDERHVRILTAFAQPWTIPKSDNAHFIDRQTTQRAPRRRTPRHVISSELSQNQQPVRVDAHHRLLHGLRTDHSVDKRAHAQPFAFAAPGLVV